MKRIFLVVIILFLSSTPLSHAGWFDDLLKGFPTSPKQSLDDSTIISGLKEALTISTDNAVGSVSKVDGYFGNEIIKILMPPKISNVADVLKKFGFQRQVDDFVLSMNRAAEKTAPQAASIFIDSIKEMTFDDARKILDGGDTAATEYFREKTSKDIYKAFKPIVSSAMNDVGVTRSYKEMMGTYTSLPFTGTESLDLDHYVTSEAIEGLFYMLAEEEKKIRTDPAARVTELLKTVFGD
jgi:RNA binding exosome subunit